MKANERKVFWTLAVLMVLTLLMGSLMHQTPVSAQVTATATSTATVTQTPTRTPTPIATPLPMVNNPAGLYNGVQVGSYGVPTPATSGSAFQSTVGSIDLYSAAGRRTFNVDNETGNVANYGTLTTTGNVVAASADIGGGYGSTGCTLTSGGRLSCNDYLQADSTITSGNNSGSAGGIYVTDGGSNNTITATGSTGVLNATTIQMGGVAFSGPVKYGTAASYTSGASITHGFSVTPTMCIIFPNQSVTATLTLAATTFSSNMASSGSPIYWMCGK